MGKRVLGDAAHDMRAFEGEVDAGAFDCKGQSLLLVTMFLRLIGNFFLGGGTPFRVSNKPLILRTHSVEILNAIAS